MLFLWWHWPREVMPDLPHDLAHDWFGLATWALIVIGFVICVTLIYRIKLGVDETNRQVKNGRKSPLRGDLDELLLRQDQILAKVEDHSMQLTALKEEGRAERRERRDDVTDLRQDFIRKLSDLAEQIEQK